MIHTACITTTDHTDLDATDVASLATLLGTVIQREKQMLLLELHRSR